MTPDIHDLIERLGAGLEGVTPGEWQVITTEHPYILPASDSRPERRGAHLERIIATAKDDPQAKCPMPIVGLAVGVGSEPGERVHMVRVSEEDARHIALCSPPNICALLSHIAALSADLASAKEALGECQRVLVMLTEPREIRATNVSTAWATAVAAELRARTTLRSLNKEDGR